MTSRFDMSGVTFNRAGISLLEILVALALLTLLLLTVTRSFSGPSPALQARNIATKVIEQAGFARQTAIRNGAKEVFTLPTPVTNCANAPATPLTFFPDGSVLSGPLCIAVDTTVFTLSVDAITGRITLE